MKRNEREKSWKSIAKNAKQSNNKLFDDDINNLNEDDSFSPIEETEENIPLTEEEKKMVRKKLFILLIIIIIVIIALIAIRIIEPYNKIDTNTNNEESQTEEKEEENNEVEEPKEDDTTLISKMKDGTIDSNNPDLNILINEIKYKTKDNYSDNSFELFKNDNTNISVLSNKSKLFLMSKTNDFSAIVSEKIIISVVEQNNIVIEISKIDEILKNRFNTSVTEYENFVYFISNEDDELLNIIFSKNGSNYIGVLSNTVKTTPISEQQFLSATKKENKIYIDMKVVFIKENTVYKDPNFTTLIEPNPKENDYFLNANTYRYTYNITDSGYVLTNVSLLK